MHSHCVYQSPARSFSKSPLLLLALGVATLLQFGIGQTQAQPSPAFDRKFWLTDGPVNSVLVTNGAIYVGGDFSYVGPRTGPAGVFDQVTGEWLRSPPPVLGVIRTVVPDGHGGWFVGGNFTHVGATPIAHLAHLNADLSLDTRWNASVQGAAVYALALKDGVLYVGGQFTRVRGKTASGLIGLAAADAQVTWDPLFAGTVYALDVANGLVYVGGSFYSVGYSNRQNLAAIDVSTALANAWNPAADGPVYALKAAGTTTYVGGQFTAVGTKPRNRLAALDSGGVAINWNPNPNGLVRALATSGTSVYVAGDFSTIGGQNRRGFAVVNTGNGAAQSLNLDIQPPTVVAGMVRSILLDGSSVYIGGSLTNGLGALHRLLLGFSVPGPVTLPTPAASEYNGTVSGYGVNALAAADGLVFVGGEFLSMGGVARHRAAALSQTTGSALPWAPSFSGPVLTMAYGSNVIYAGGNFTNVNATNYVRGLAAVDPYLGNHRPEFNFLGTNQYGDATVASLVVSSNRLYVGGAFIAVADQSRRFLAAVNADNGLPISGFNAKLGGGFSGVATMVMVQNNLYVAGDFTTVNSQSVPRLAKVSAVDGAFQNWTPNPNQAVYTLAAANETLYVGGVFTVISGTAFRNFAAYSTFDDSLMGVDAALPTYAGGITTVAATPSTLYVGGSFEAIGGEFRRNLACLASFNASAYEWDPAPDYWPNVISVTDELAVIGGAFKDAGRSPTNTATGFLMVYPRGAMITRAAKTTSGALQLTCTTGDRTDCIIQSTEDLLSHDWVTLATNEMPGYRWTYEVPVTSGNKLFRAVAR